MRAAHRIRIATSAILTCVLVTAGGAADPGGFPPEAPTPESVEDGRQLFRIYCVGCHGLSARGDGPAAGRLRTPPTDLTRIEPAEDGTFPRERIHRAIGGIEETPGHGPREMPLWGFAFSQLDSDADPGDQVRSRIASLVDYLETLQAPPD
jgi:mono/diheme cytochrome c family protein